MTVLPRARHSASRSLLRRKRVISSSAANGSSIRRISGSVTSARASDTRIFMPPESSRGKASAKSARPDAGQRLIGPRARLRLRNAGEPQRQPHVLAHAGPGHQRRLLEHEADAVTRQHIALVARHPHDAGRWRAELCDQAQRRRLAATGRAQQRDELALAHGEVERAERHDAIVIRLRHAAQADGESRQAGLDPGRGFARMTWTLRYGLLGRSSTPTPLLTKRSV